MDIEAKNLSDICEIVGHELISKGIANEEVVSKMCDLWQKKHRHQFEGPRKVEGKLTSVIRDLLVQKLENKVFLCTAIAPLID